MLIRVLAASLLLGVIASPSLAQEADAGKALAKKVSAACGSGSWDMVRMVSFTWRHMPSGNDRGYVWDVPKGTVEMTVRGQTVKTTVAGPKERGPEQNAHKAWVNDSYWAMCALKLEPEEGVAFEDLGQVDVPKFEDLGKRRALRVRYEGKGGYTPGDHYVLYLGDDHRPVAWAFHRGGAKDPTMVTTWGGYQTVGGLAFPTQFKLPGGKLVIAIEGISVAQRAPSKAGTSRPAKAETSRPSK